MTMLELLELQARARAIRSQLSLEPVTKIDLRSEDEEEAAENSNGKAGTSAAIVEKEKTPAPAPQPEIIAKALEKRAKDVPVRRVIPPPPPAKPKPSPPAKPVKLKRNYKTNSNATGNSSSNVHPEKEPTPPKAVESEKNGRHPDEDDDDVINMDPIPETFFISDSDEEPPAKKSPLPERNDATSVKEASKSPDPEKKIDEPGDHKKSQEPEDGEISGKNSRESSPLVEDDKQENSLNHNSPMKTQASDNALHDDDVVHLMSDTEIDLHHHSDKEEDEFEAKPTEIAKEKSPEPEKEKSLVPQTASTSLNQPQSDNDDVVEIHNSSDDELMNESDKSASESPKKSQTWEERWLSSSKTQNILKTTQLKSRVRGKIIKTKKSLKASDKKKEESEKAIKEKVSGLEEGSMEQFNVIKDKSN